ncbi:MAG: hypothetical protein ACOX5R_20460, partial [bacterium]
QISRSGVRVPPRLNLILLDLRKQITPGDIQESTMLYGYGGMKPLEGGSLTWSCPEGASLTGSCNANQRLGYTPACRI